MDILGKHLLVEFTDCDREALNDLKRMEKILVEAAQKAGATIVDSVFHLYNPHGVSGVIVIAESHMSIHTWPEYGYAAVDFFTCGERVDPWIACHYMNEQLGGSMNTREINRGIPGDVDRIIPHKPESEASPKKEVA